MTDGTARQIVQDFLDRQGHATISGDIDETLKWCDIPCTLESMEGRTVARTEAEMRAICAAFIDGLKQRRLTHLERRCIEASFKEDGSIWAAYETRYVAQVNILSGDPYAGFVILRHRGDRWKISTMQFAVTSDSPANATLRDWVPPKPGG